MKIKVVTQRQREARIEDEDERMLAIKRSQKELLFKRNVAAHEVMFSGRDFFLILKILKMRKESGSGWLARPECSVGLF